VGGGLPRGGQRGVEGCRTFFFGAIWHLHSTLTLRLGRWGGQGGKKNGAGGSAFSSLLQQEYLANFFPGPSLKKKLQLERGVRERGNYKWAGPPVGLCEAPKRLKRGENPDAFFILQVDYPAFSFRGDTFERGGKG